MNKKYYLALLILIFLGINKTNAQRITVGAGAITNTSIAGPLFSIDSSASHSFFAMIYPEASFPGILHQDTIEAIDFQRNLTIDSIRGNSSCRIWMSNTALTDFGAANINFQAEILNISAPLVYNANPNSIIGNSEGFKKFTLQTKYEYDTTKGKNLVLFVEYVQDSFPISPVFWNCDNANGINGYANNQVKFSRDTGTIIPTTSNSSTSLHPQIRLDIPRADYEGNIIIPYTYGKIPVPLGNPDTIKLRVTNLGKKDATGLKAFVTSRGANVFTDSVIMNLPKFEDVIISFPTRTILNEGLDTLLFTLPNDLSLTNNTREHVRLATESVYSYRDVSEPLAPGGIGFNGGTGDFVCRFSSNEKKLINQIEVNFGAAGRPFKIGIWKSNISTGKPDSLIWESDSATSQALSTVPVIPPVEVDGDFYTGVRQMGTNNVAFGYQLESPVRPRTFWYATPLGDTNWVDFAPNAPFKFMIEPRVQSQYDVMVFSIDSPKVNDKIDFYNFDTIRPKATIYNLGAEDIDTPITFVCKMYIDALEVLSIEHKDTIASGTFKQITFDTAFVPPFTGQYTMQIYPIWQEDQVTFNDSAEINFAVEYYNDIGPDFGFTPFEGQRFEYNRDTVKPIFRIRNYAFNAQFNFKVRTRIISTKGLLVFQDSTTIAQLDPGATSILNTKFWPANVNDTLFVEFITELATERTNSNDTLRRTIFVLKTRDAVSEEIIVPADQAAYDNNSPMPRPQVRVFNDGLLAETSMKSYISIVDENLNPIYSDTQTYPLFSKTSTLVNFIDTLNITAKGKYFATVVTRTIDDFEFTNDTLRSEFYYGFERDASADTLILPDPSITYELNTGNYVPIGVVSNKGYDSLRNAAVKVEGIKEGQLFYISSKTVTLDSNQSTQVVFDNNLVFSKAGLVQLRLITLHINDQNVSNDTFIQNYNVQVSNDVGVDSITNPGSLIRIPSLTTFNPTLQISNYGLAKQLGGFDINCKILNPQGLVVYDETENFTLDSAETKLVTFTKPVTLADTGTYSILARSLMTTDQLLSNDNVAQNFTVYYASNNKISDNFPQAGQRYIPNQFLDTIHPRIAILKTGEDNLADTGMAYLKLTGRTSGYSYFDSLNFSIPANKDTTLVFGNTYNSNIKDTFDAQAWIISKYDGIEADNAINFEYSVNFGVGIKDINDLFYIGPNPSNGLFTLKTKTEISLSSYRVIDNTGKEVSSKNFKKDLSETQIDLQHLPDGIYFLLLNDFNTKIKLIKVSSN